MCFRFIPFYCDKFGQILKMFTIVGSNKVGKWKSCHQERELEHFGVTMAKPLWSSFLHVHHSVFHC
jgi:hypothetical protein